MKPDFVLTAIGIVVGFVLSAGGTCYFMYTLHQDVKATVHHPADPRPGPFDEAMDDMLGEQP